MLQVTYDLGVTEYDTLFLYRISKSAWLEDHEHPHVAAISRRVEDISGLTTETAESLQVVNYGIGGHYEPHFDFARVNNAFTFFYLITLYKIYWGDNFVFNVFCRKRKKMRSSPWARVTGSRPFYFT